MLPDLAGKGGRIRTVPVPTFVKARVDTWIAAAKLTEGPVFRSVGKGGVLKPAAMDVNAVWLLVEQHARAIGMEKLTPHDLRRTCAKLCRAAGGDLEQIQLLLGHASIQTTERYLGTRQNLVDAVNDRLGLITEEPVAFAPPAPTEEPEDIEGCQSSPPMPHPRPRSKRRKRRNSSSRPSAAQLRREGEFLDAVVEASRRFGLGVFRPAMAPAEFSSFSLPAGVHCHRELGPDGMAFVFDHERLGRLGRILVLEHGSDQTEFRCEVFGTDPGDPAFLERKAVFEPIARDVMAAIERGQRDG